MLRRVAHYNRERIRRGATVDKAVVKKNLGRLTRELSYIILQPTYLTTLCRSLSESGAGEAARVS